MCYLEERPLEVAHHRLRFHSKGIELLEEGVVVVLSLSGEKGVDEKEAVAIFEESMVSLSEQVDAVHSTEEEGAAMKLCHIAAYIYTSLSYHIPDPDDEEMQSHARNVT